MAEPIPYIDDFSPSPNRQTDSREQFTIKMDTRLSEENRFTGQANALADFLNARATGVDESVAAAAEGAAQSAHSAGEAARSVGEVEELKGQIELTAEELESLNALWLGAASSDPTAGKAGAALVAGNAYVNTASGYLRAYNGAGWVQGITAVAGVTSVDGKDGALTADDIASSINAQMQSTVLAFI